LTGPSALPCVSTAARTLSVHCPTMPITRTPVTVEALFRPLSYPGKNTRTSAKRRARSDASRKVVRLCRAGGGACLALARTRRNKVDVVSGVMGCTWETPQSLLSFLMWFRVSPVLSCTYPFSSLDSSISLFIGLFQP
jgi:hypothetical protein